MNLKPADTLEDYKGMRLAECGKERQLRKGGLTSIKYIR